MLSKVRRPSSEDAVAAEACLQVTLYGQELDKDPLGSVTTHHRTVGLASAEDKKETK
jgi:hypothetical protein